MKLNNSNLFTGNDFLVYLISVFIVYIQTKNVKKSFDTHYFISIESVMENTSVEHKIENGKKTTEFIKF